MKRFVALAVVAVMISVTPAMAHAAVRPVSATLSGDAEFVVGWCCGDVWGLTGRGVVQGVGAVTFAANYTIGVNPYFTFVEGVGYVEPYEELRGLQLTITAANGDELSLAGYSSWSQADPAPPLEWHVVGGTGRFAGLAGSGTYDAVLVGSSATLTLDGRIGS